MILQWVNVGTGMDLSILSLAKLIAKVVGFEGKFLPTPVARRVRR